MERRPKALMCILAVVGDADGSKLLRAYADDAELGGLGHHGGQVPERPPG
jgi:hypothetical protein